MFSKGTYTTVYCCNQNSKEEKISTELFLQWLSRHTPQKMFLVMLYRVTTVLFCFSPASFDGCCKRHFFQKSLWLDAEGLKPSFTPRRGSAFRRTYVPKCNTDAEPLDNLLTLRPLHHGSDMCGSILDCGKRYITHPNPKYPLYNKPYFCHDEYRMR